MVCCSIPFVPTRVDYSNLKGVDGMCPRIILGEYKYFIIFLCKNIFSRMNFDYDVIDYCLIVLKLAEVYCNSVISDQ